MKFAISTSGALSALLLLAGEATAHSWPEVLQRIGKNGEFLDSAKGYTRNFRPREGKENDNFQKNLGGPNDPIKGPICNPVLGGMADGYKNNKYPKLKAAPGEMIAIRYMENGHVTLPIPQKPKNQGTVYIYATTEPRDNTQIQDVHHKWTADGKGGDKKGRLLAKRNYDDGRCFEKNDVSYGDPKKNDGRSGRALREGFKQDGKDSGPANWCQNDIKLPADIKQGDVTLYWVWDFSQLDKANTAETSDNLAGAKIVSKEFYSTCMEVSIDGSLKSNEPFQFNDKQNLRNAADPAQLKMGYLDGAPKGDAPKQGNQQPKKDDKKDDKPDAPKTTPPASAAPPKPPAVTSVPTTLEKQVKTVTVTQAATTVTVTAAPGGAAPTPAPADPKENNSKEKNPKEKNPKENNPKEKNPEEAPKEAPKENKDTNPVTNRPEVDPIPMLLRRGQGWFGVFRA